MKPDKNLQVETLETRLNLSAMQIGLGHDAIRPIISAGVSQQGASRVISLTLDNGSTRSVTTWAELAHTKEQHGAITTTVTKAPAKVVNRHPAKPVKPVTTTTPPTTTPSVVAPATTTTTTTTTTNTTPAVIAPDPLAPILAQLYGDDVHDDSATIQSLIDTANAQGIKNITLPAGTFLLNSGINFYGSGITLSGQGASTIFDVDNHYTGVGIKGVAFNIQAILSANPLMIAQPVTGNTIVFQGAASLQVGQSLYLSNGLGSTALVEARNGGTLTAPGEFFEDGPDEYVTIASITTDAQGNTVAQLTQNVVGTDDYFNVAPGGITSKNYLHAAAITTPADHLTLENLNIQFKDMAADSAILSKFTNSLTIQNVSVLNKTLLGGLGGLALVGGTDTTLSNVNCTANIALNSTRLASITNCTANAITLEEACTDNFIAHNTLTGTTSCDFRINDMACERNVFEYNTLHGGVQNTGAIGIWEGINTTVAFNTVSGGNTGIWAGLTKGTIVDGNIGGGFSDIAGLTLSQVFNNSWQ
jgi:hypothetical protein